MKENLGLSGRGGVFGQLPVAFKQRLFGLFLSDVLQSEHLGREGCFWPQLPSEPGSKSPFQHPRQVVLQPLPALLSCGSGTVYWCELSG